MGNSPTLNVKQTEASKYALNLSKEYNLTLTSAWRSPEESKRVGGYVNDDHTKGTAYDFGGSFKNMKDFATKLYSTGRYTKIIFENKNYITGNYVPDHMDHVHVSWEPGDSEDMPAIIPGELGESAAGIIQSIVDSFKGKDGAFYAGVALLLTSIFILFRVR